MSDKENQQQNTQATVKASIKKASKKIIHIKLPDENAYVTASVAQLIAVVFIRSKKDLYTQKDIADEISTITNGQRSITQGTISKVLTRLARADLTVNNRKVTVWRTPNEGYGFFFPGENADDLFYDLFFSGLFLESGVFCNNPGGLSTLYIFKVAPKHHAKVKEMLAALLSADGIFDFMTDGNNLIVLLNARSSSFKENTAILKQFVIRCPVVK